MSYVGAEFSLGSDSPKRIVEVFIDFHCPFSRKAWITMSKVVDKAADVQFRFLLWVQPWHTHAFLMAQAAVVATFLGGDFKKMADLLFADQDVKNELDDLSTSAKVDMVAQLAAKAGCKDVDAFKAGMNPYDDSVTVLKRHQKYGRQNGVHESPSFMIDGLLNRKASSSMSVEEWVTLLSG